MTRYCLFVTVLLFGCKDQAAEKRVAELEVKLSEFEKRLAEAEKPPTLLDQLPDFSKRLDCLDAQRAMKAAWLEHAREARTASGFACPSGVAICPGSGLPPRTFGNYKLQVMSIFEGTDGTFSDLSERRSMLPKLPIPTVDNPRFERMAQTRLAAEASTDAFLALCKPPDPKKP